MVSLLLTYTLCNVWFTFMYFFSKSISDHFKAHTSPILNPVYRLIKTPKSLISFDWIQYFSIFFLSLSLNTSTSFVICAGVDIKLILKFISYFISAYFNIAFKTVIISFTVLLDNFSINCSTNKLKLYCNNSSKFFSPISFLIFVSIINL